MSTEKNDSHSIIAVILAPFILLAPVLLSGKALYWGTVSLQFLPWRYVAWETIKMGEWPLWNPMVGMGAPLLANYQSGLFYPPNWLVLLSGMLGGIGWAAWVQTLLVACHWAWGGIGMVLLARRLGYGSLAQAICGLAFALSSYFVARSGFLSINSALAWMPWVIFAVTLLTYKGITFSVLIGSTLVISMLLLSGHAQTAWYTLIYAVIWVMFLGYEISYRHTSANASTGLFSIKRVAVQILHNLMRLLIVVLIAVILTSVQLIPTAELLLQSQRSNSITYDFAMTYSFWPWRLLTFFAPAMFGSPVSGDYWGYGNYWEDAVYIGLLPVIFAIFAVASNIKNKKNGNDRDAVLNYGIIRRDLVIFLVLVTSASLLLALGKNTPIFPWFYAHIPSFKLFQAPARLTIWAIFSLILLGGIGIDNLRRPTGKALYWTRLGTAGALAISIGSGLTWYLLGEVSPTFIRATALMGLIGFLTGVLVLLVPDRQNSAQGKVKGDTPWVWAVIILVSCDLLIAGWNLNPGISRDYFEGYNPSLELLQPLKPGEKIYLPEEDEYELKFKRFMRFDTFQLNRDWSKLRQTLLPNLNVMDGVSSVNNFEPLVPARYARWMEELEKNPVRQDRDRYEKLLNLMGVGVLEKVAANATAGVRFDRIDGDSSRIRWIPCAYFTNSEEEAWDRLFRTTIDLNREVILEGRGDGGDADCVLQGGDANIQVVSDEPNWLEVRSVTSSDGWLLLSDVWYPGWRAEIDGEPTDILRANYLFRAVALEAGVHEIVFKYDPISFRLGMAISLAGWVGIVLLWVVHSITQRKPAL